MIADAKFCCYSYLWHDCRQWTNVRISPVSSRSGDGGLGACYHVQLKSEPQMHGYY